MGEQQEPSVTAPRLTPKTVSSPERSLCRVSPKPVQSAWPLRLMLRYCWLRNGSSAGMHHVVQNPLSWMAKECEHDTKQTKNALQ